MNVSMKAFEEDEALMFISIVYIWRMNLRVM